jgi:ribonuclease P protein component
MFQQENRLRKLRDFNLVLQHGQWLNGQFLDIKYLELAKKQDFFPKKEDPENFKKQLKLAIAVGLKISKSAVRRNRIKRQVREVLRLLIKENALKIGFYILVIVKKSILEKEYADISQEIKVLLQKGKLLN